MPGFFNLYGEKYGYQYETANHFAQESKQSLAINKEISIKKIKEGLEDGTIDVAATLSKRANKLSKILSLPLYTTSYVILSSTRHSTGVKSSPIEIIGDKRVLISSGFTETDSYDMLLDSLPKAHMYPSSKGALCLMDQLVSGDYDLLICEKSEAQIGCALRGDVRKITEFDEEVGMSLLFANKDIKNNFMEWHDNFRRGEEFAMLNHLYFNQGVVGQLTEKHVPARKPGSISAWDDMIRTACEREGLDWRLLSAIAFNESSFRPSAVSHRGAVGLMQVMPIVAREFEVDETELMNPEINIMLATKMLKKIEKTLKFHNDIPDYDRYCILLASYNCGISRVMQACKIVEKRGGDRNSWDDVAKCLVDMGNDSFIEENSVKSGIFRRSGETFAYVDKVMSKYDSYCLRAS